MMSVLKKIEGKLITEVRTEISELHPLNGLGDDLIECPIYIQMEDYSINIYNPLTIVSSAQSKSLKQLLNKRILQVNETSELIEIILEDNLSIKIDIREESFNGPEALSLYGPDNLIVVWN